MVSQLDSLNQTEVIYPESDGQPMADNTKQFRWIDEESVTQLAKLPTLHRDPFDRLLICQALQHELVIVTADSAIMAYWIIQFLE